MMKCPNCSKEIPDGNSFCSGCGAPLNAVPAEKPVKPKKPVTKKWWFWVLISLAAIVTVGAVAGGGKDEKALDSSEVLSTTEDDRDQSKTTDSETTAESDITAEAPAMPESDYKASCEAVSYEDIARQPDLYNGKNVVFTGKVIQVQEGSWWSSETIYRINVTQGEYLWSDTVYVTYKLPEGSPRILEDDIVTFYGICTGTETYTTVLGSSVTIPSVEAQYIDIQ